MILEVAGFAHMTIKLDNVGSIVVYTCHCERHSASLEFKKLSICKYINQNH